MTTNYWLAAFGVATTDLIGETEAFQRMLCHKDFKDATGYYIDHEGFLWVTSPTARWMWDKLEGPCMCVQTIHPVKIKPPKIPANWVFERSSGFAGYRCHCCGVWVYEDAWAECECNKKPSPTLPCHHGG